MTAALRNSSKPGLTLVTAPIVADIYLRLSDLRDADMNEDGHGKTFEDRETKLRAFAARLGYTVGLVIVENDEIEKARTSKGKTVVRKVRGASAFKRTRTLLPNGKHEWRVYRPGFRKILDRLNAGQSHALLAEDLDRTMRDPRDLEDFIDVARARKVNARSLSGSLTFTEGGTDNEIMSARIAVVVANKSSADTARRVAASRERRANNGEFGGGRRPFGFEADGVTKRPDECKIIADCSRRLLQIDGHTRKRTSLRSLALELRDADVPTVTGTAWSAESLRDILMRPRNAGLMVYQGAILEGAPCPWKPIVRRDVYDAVVTVLTDPSRKCGTGNPPKYIGTNIYRCATCTPLGIEPTGTKTMQVCAQRESYRCANKGHLSINQPKLDAHVVAHLLSLLSLPNAIDLFTPERPDVDVAGLRDEAAAKRVKLDEFSSMFADDLISRSQLVAGTEKIKARLDAINAELMSAVVDSPVAALLREGVDVVAAWKALPLANRRAVLDSLVTVTVLPAPDGKRGWDPNRVVITPKNTQNEIAA